MENSIWSDWVVKVERATDHRPIAVCVTFSFPNRRDLS